MHNGQGQRQQVIEASIGAGSLIAKGMARKGCKVSGSKFVIRATDQDLATAVQEGIHREAGILLPIVQTARDLGIDSGFSKRRREPTASSRVKKSGAKLKRLLQLSKITTMSRRLFRTGVVPQIAWGQEANWLAPTVVGEFRTRAGKGTGRLPHDSPGDSLRTRQRPSQNFPGQSAPGMVQAVGFGPQVAGRHF